MRDAGHGERASCVRCDLCIQHLVGAQREGRAHPPPAVPPEPGKPGRVLFVEEEGKGEVIANELVRLLVCAGIAREA